MHLQVPLNMNRSSIVRPSSVFGKSENIFWQDTLLKRWISNLYILLKSAIKMQETSFQRPKFQNIFGGACPRTPIKLYRHYGLPFIKILATPLVRPFEVCRSSRPCIFLLTMQLLVFMKVLLFYWFPLIFSNSNEISSSCEFK